MAHIHPSIHPLFLYAFIYPCIPYMHSYIHPSIKQSTLSSFMYLFLCSFIHQSPYPSIHSSIYQTIHPLFLFSFNPILTGLFESKFLLGGGGGVNLTPPSDLGPFGADCREILHGCQDTCKECYNLFSAENGLFIMLL